MNTEEPSSSYPILDVISVNKAVLVCAENGSGKAKSEKETSKHTSHFLSSKTANAAKLIDFLLSATHGHVRQTMAQNFEAQASYLASAASC